MSGAPALPRRGRVLPSVIVALVLVGAGVTLVVDVIAVALRHHALIWPYEQMAGEMRRTHWSDVPIVVIAAVTVAIGILLLELACVPGRQKVVPLEPSRSDESVGLTKRTLRRALYRAVDDLDGVAKVGVRLHRRKVSLTVHSVLRDEENLEADARAAVEGRLEELQLVRSPGVSVRVLKRNDD
jgi:hypothetical protein